jgi:Carboxypeptidase regulatory-like domain/TonB dependent receptor
MGSRQTFFAVVLIGWGVLPGVAQIDRANLNGTVSDPSGANVPDAKVEVVAPDTGYKRQASTGNSGVYSITGLPIGMYDLTISHEGFKTFEQKGIALLVGQTRTINAPLVVGAAIQKVDVQATVQALESANAELGGVVQSQQVQGIPLNGRDWAVLMALAPGAINVGGGGQRDTRFVGRAIDDSNYTFDGLDATGVQEQSQKVGVRLAISLESIAEFRVSSSVYTAEKGGSAGAQISIVSKAGTNAFHGGVFEFLRNDVFDARSPFDFPGVPPFRLNQFGGSLGGPIKKNRTFFFLDYEGLRQRLHSTIIGFVPNAAYRASVAATSPILKPFLDSWPVGQTHLDSLTDQWSSVGLDSRREDSGIFRLDHTFTDRTSIFGRFSIDDANVSSPLDTLGGRDNPLIRPSNLVIQLTHVFSPTIVNEVRAGFNRSALHHYFNGTSPLSTANGEPGYVGVSVSGFDTPNATALDTEVGTTIDVYDDLSIVRGRHTIKLGIGVERHRLNNSSEGIADGTLSYSSPQDFVNNVLSDYSFVGQLTLGGNRRTYIMPYVQDTFKVRSNLTLNLGLRYEYYTVLHEVAGRIAVVKLSCGGFCPKGTPLYFPDRTDFMPRLGLAWVPGGPAGRTVVRAGFGMYFSPNQMDDFSDGHESTGQRFDVSSASVPGLTWPVSQALLPAPSYSPKTWDQHRKDGYNEDWDLTVQQLLPNSFVGQIAYQGSEGHRLFSATRVNRIDPLTGTRPLPDFGEFNQKANLGNSNFHSLQVSLKRSLTGGWMWETQYMWSHALSDNGFGAGQYPHIENYACIKCSYSDSDIDIRHSFSANSVYVLPIGPGKRFLNGRGIAGKLVGGWQLSGVATATSGRPIDILVDRNPSDLPDGSTRNQRPDLVPGMSIYPTHQTINNWFNPAAFAVPAPGTWGNLGRNVGRGPGYYEIDTALEKETSITERLGLKFRVEAFNLLNHPIYGDPASDISSGSFGIISSQLNSGATGIGTSRRIQFMLRLQF